MAFSINNEQRNMIIQMANEWVKELKPMDNLSADKWIQAKLVAFDLAYDGLSKVLSETPGY